MRRRHFLERCAAGLAVVATGCGTVGRRTTAPTTSPLPSPTTSTLPTPATVPGPVTTTTLPAWSKADAFPTPLPPIPPPHPGPARLFGTKVVAGTQQVALTIDDGFDQPTAEAYVAWALATGIPITFSPNGQYHKIWDPLAAQLAPAIARQQVQIANHTYSHPNLLRVGTAGITAELERNEAWIEHSFGITSRPWFRPPFGVRNNRTDAAAAALGFTNILMWNGSLGDAALLTPQVLLAQAQRWLQPGRVVLGHANHPTVTHLYDQLVALIDTRGLRPATLDELYGTSRANG